MRKFLALGIILLLSTPHLAFADDQGSPGTPAPVSQPTLNSQPTANTKPTSNAKTLLNELTKIRATVERKDYKAARSALLLADKEFPKNADINNLLGYTSRKLMLYTAAASYYKRALAINPDHLGALEYQGELFMLTKKFDLAKKNLAKLKQLCGVRCEEYLDLAKAIGGK